MKRENNEKDTIIKLYRDNISEIIWTHKIQATILDDLKRKNKIYKISKELLVGLSSFISVLFLYYEKYTGALISSAVSTVSIIFDNVINFSDFENRIRITNENVNNLWYMKKLLTMNLGYLENDIIDWNLAKSKLEKNLEYRKSIYSNLESASNKIMKDVEFKLKVRKDEEVTEEFFEESEWCKWKIFLMNL